MSQADHPLPQALDITDSAWQQTPTSVKHQLLSLRKRVDALEARLNRDSSHSSRPPSPDSPAKKRKRRRQAAERRKPGAKPGHPGHRQVMLEPTTPVVRFPQPCACGQSAMTHLAAYHTHQVIELPVSVPEVTHWILHQGHCLTCGKLRKASIPRDHLSGYGPRLTAFVGEMAGVVSTSRSAIQDLCASVCAIPLSSVSPMQLRSITSMQRRGSLRVNDSGCGS